MATRADWEFLSYINASTPRKFQRIDLALIIKGTHVFIILKHPKLGVAA